MGVERTDIEWMHELAEEKAEREEREEAQKRGLSVEKLRAKKKSAEKFEVDCINDFFEETRKLFNMVGTAMHKKVNSPRDMGGIYLFNVAIRVLNNAKRSGIYQAVMQLMEYTSFLRDEFKKMPNIGNVKKLEDDFKRFFSEFRNYIDYWEYIKLHKKLPAFSKYNRISPEEEKKKLFRDFNITSKIMSGIINKINS